MRIGIDVRCLAEGRRTGVEEYTLNLLQNLFEADKKNDYILFFNAYKSKADFSWLKKYPNVTLKKFNFPNKLLNFLFWYLNWPKLDKMIGGVDLFFMPNIIFGSVSKKTKLIITIHDLSFEHYPESFSLKRRFWHIFVNPKKICQRAHGIIAVSESTKNDLIKIYKINPRKIEVIYSAVSEKFSIISRNDEKMIKVKEKYKLPYKFILYLGTIEPRKNIIGIIRFFNNLQKIGLNENKYKELLDYKLVIAGSKGWLSKEFFSELKKSEFKNSISFVNYIPDSDKEHIFNLASLFVYPSFFEGFGLPVLEAMSCGVPVITSNVSSLPEVVSDAAVMIDPNKPQEITEAAINIILNKEFRENLIKKGIGQSKKFHWQKTAKDFISFSKERLKKA